MGKKDPFSFEGEIKDIKDKTVNRYSNGFIIDEQLSKNDEEQNYLTRSFNFNKLSWLIYLLIVLFGFIIIRVGYLQIARGQEYRMAAEQNRVRIVSEKAPRGIIYDRNNTKLVHNIPNFFLEAIPSDLPQDNTTLNGIIERISQILEIDTLEISQLLDQIPQYSYQPYKIQEEIDYEKAVLIKIESKDWPGFNLKTSAIREYIDGSTTSHIIGYTGKISPDEYDIYQDEDQDYQLDDYIGKTGIEYNYEQNLKGVNGKKQIEVDSHGKESKTINQAEYKTGNNLILTVDYKLQKKLSELLDNKVIDSNIITGAAAVAIDPNNGEVLAMVSSPSFNNNSFVLGIGIEEYESLLENPQMPLFNRAISGEYPSGSIIKPLIASAALQEDIIDSDTSFNSTGGIKITQWFFPDWKAGGHGSTNVTKAIAESVNTFFYIIGGGYEEVDGLGVDKIKYYAELYGLNSILGIDIPAEKSGFLPTKEWKEKTKNERWYIGDTYHLAIGQGDILVTPLQIANYFAAIANGGTLYKPYLVQQISNSNNEIIEKIKPEPIRSGFIDSNHIKTIQEGLRQSVLSGSSISMSDLPFAVAGKTGTAQFGNQDKTHAWYTGYAPYDSPEIVITVLIESGGEGHAAALPIAKEAMKFWFNNK